MELQQDVPWSPEVFDGIALFYYPTFGSLSDAYLLCLCSLWHRWHNGQQLIPSYGTQHLTNWAYPALCLITSTYLLWRLSSYDADSQNSPIQKIGPTRPLLFPCRTTHTRLFPKKHSFVYSYLMVGVPVEWEGTCGSMISNGVHSATKKGWFQIDAADYLERGCGHLGLRGKLDAYLKSQGSDPTEYPYAYLVTAAKFLGYHFNPVSFWYLYSGDKNLTAMILEVNNTFGERRMYLTSIDPTSAMVGSIPGDMKSESKAPGLAVFRQAWPKDFHVSPFNSRKGDYSLVAHDPWAPMMQSTGSLDNVIIMASSKSHPKLIARIYSDGEALDPEVMSTWQEIKFLSLWWWVGFITFPRIVKEAGVLFFKRKLHVWYRPEPLKESIGRLADDTERQLESLFRSYLRHVVSQCPISLAVHYIPSGIPDISSDTMKSRSAMEESEAREVQELEFRVLTPAFYTRFVHYAHDFEALFGEMNESCTIWISKPDLLPKLILKKPPPTMSISSVLDYAYFKLIQKMRRRPERIERPMTSSQTFSQAAGTHSMTDIREFRISSMDGYFLGHGDISSKRLYRSLVFKLFLADKIALGSADILWGQQLLLRLFLAWMVTG